MRKLRYNELDEMDWEYKHGCYDGPDGDECGDVCWDQFGPYTHYEPEDVLDDEPVENDETGQGIFGNELNHAPSAQNEPEYEYPGDVFHVASSGQVAGMGDGDEVIFALKHLLVPDRKYHFEFKFFNAE